MANKTALQDLREMVEDMIYNGGDMDLTCVLVHIDDRIELEKKQIFEAYKMGQINIGEMVLEVSGVSVERMPENDTEDGEKYYQNTYPQSNI